jgi:hypothetical protein
VELTGQTRFYFLPRLPEGFRRLFELHLCQLRRARVSRRRCSPFDATGFAKNTAEVDLWYSKDGFEARLAFKYHSPFTVINGWDSQELLGLASETTLDFSTTYQWSDNIGLRFEAHNLTNQPERMYWNNDPNELARYDIYRSLLSDRHHLQGLILPGELRGASAPRFFCEAWRREDEGFWRWPRALIAAFSRRAGGADRYFGADLSFANEMDDCGAVYRENGAPVDVYQIFKEHGANLIRIRIWNNAGGRITAISPT